MYEAPTATVAQGGKPPRRIGCAVWRGRRRCGDLVFRRFTWRMGFRTQTNVKQTSPNRWMGC